MMVLPDHKLILLGCTPTLILSTRQKNEGKLAEASYFIREVSPHVQFLYCNRAQRKR